jgi:hypothetical protein
VDYNHIQSIFYWREYFNTSAMAQIYEFNLQILIFDLWSSIFNFQFSIMKFWFWNFDFEILILKFWFWNFWLWNFDFEIFNFNCAFLKDLATFWMGEEQQRKQVNLFNRDPLFFLTKVTLAFLRQGPSNSKIWIRRSPYQKNKLAKGWQFWTSFMPSWNQLSFFILS